MRIILTMQSQSVNMWKNNPTMQRTYANFYSNAFLRGRYWFEGSALRLKVTMNINEDLIGVVYGDSRIYVDHRILSQMSRRAADLIDDRWGFIEFVYQPL